MINHNKIKAKIIESGYTQRDLADKLGISEITLSNWCNGKLGNIKVFIELCNIINLDVRELKKD